MFLPVPSWTFFKKFLSWCQWLWVFNIWLEVFPEFTFFENPLTPNNGEIVIKFQTEIWYFPQRSRWRRRTCCTLASTLKVSPIAFYWEANLVQLTYILKLLISPNVCRSFVLRHHQKWLSSSAEWEILLFHHR